MLVERPALITSADERKGAVNLTVFFECDDEDECARGRSGDLDNDPRRETIIYNHSGEPVANTWRWPPA